MKFCDDIEGGHCCSACHTDIEQFGYSLRYRTIKGEEYELCCAMAEFVDDMNYDTTLNFHKGI